MANNRMWLTNKRTGAKLLLAKYYPATGWYPFHDDIHDKIWKLFQENEPQASIWGDNDWTLEYEQEAEPRIEGATPPRGILTPVGEPQPGRMFSDEESNFWIDLLSHAKPIGGQ